MGFARFNVVYLNGLIYVLYAKKNIADPTNDLSGPGNGYINVFNTAGTWIRRFYSEGVLNSPWALTLAPTIICAEPGSIMVGNFGDGRINIFSASGTFLFTLRDCNHRDIVIDGLWGLTTNTQALSPIYFASGPNAETNGLVGKLIKNCN